MKRRLTLVVFLLLEFEACADLLLRHLSEGESVRFSCSLHPRQHLLLSSLHLYHRASSGQTSLLSLSRGGEEVWVDPQTRARLLLVGGVNSREVNVTLSELQTRDGGLYLWELHYREEVKEAQQEEEPPRLHSIIPGPKVFLMVQGGEGGRRCSCSSSYSLLLSFSSSAGLLLLLLLFYRCVRIRPRPLRPHPLGPQHLVPVYEEMSRKLRRPGSPKTTRPEKNYTKDRLSGEDGHYNNHTKDRLLEEDGHYNNYTKDRLSREDGHYNNHTKDRLSGEDGHYNNFKDPEKSLKTGEEAHYDCPRLTRT